MSQEIFSPGYISARAIQDVFTYRLSQLQHELLPPGTPQRRLIIEWVDALRVELLSKADNMPQAKAQRKPQPKVAPRGAAESDGDELVPDSRDAYNAYVARNRRT